MGVNIGFTVVNPAVTAGDPPVSQGVIYQGVPATLDLTLTNGTGGPITFKTGSPQSSFEIFMPQSWFTDQQLQAMVITPSEGWTPSYNAGEQSWMLTFGGTDGTTWPDGAPLSFSIASLVATAQPASDSIQIN